MKLFILGGVLTLISWIFAWGKFHPVSQYTFLPLWLGFILTVNGLSQVLFKTSLLSMMQKKFILLFLVSIPLWWIFEWINLTTKNWNYLLPAPVSTLKYFLGGSIYFSTVVPAVLSISFLFYLLINKVKPVKRRSSTINRTTLFISFILGIIFILLIFLLPHLYFPLLWGGIFLLLEPINYLLKFPSLFKKIEQGEWTLVLSIMVATLFTGFWWELWNYYSFPKWTYNVPELGFFKVFEMPILGYLGYPFFGLEVYSFTSFSFGILRKMADNLKSLP